MAVPMKSELATFEQAMARLGTDMVDAFNRGDVGACMEYYTDDATLLIPDRPPIKGREAIKAVLRDHANAGTKMTAIDPLEVGSSGDLGYYAGTCEFDMPADDGSTVKQTGKFVSVFRLQGDGSWKAVIDSLTRDTATGSN